MRTREEEEREDQRFKQAIVDSQPAVDAVRDHYLIRGYQSEKHPVRIRPTFNQRHLYGDEYDVRIRKDNMHPWITIEVKSRWFDFTDIFDFYDENMLIDRQDKVDTNPNDYYINVSNDLQYAAIAVRSQTQRYWIRCTKFDKSKGYDFHKYECPLQHVRFFKLLK